MKPTYSYELAQRSLANYKKILELQNNGDKVYATVSLISSMLFIIAMPNDWGMLACLEQGKINTFVRESSFPNEVKKFLNDKKFLVALRNSVVHGDINIIVDESKNSICGVSFNIEINNKIEELQFFEEHLYEFLKHLTELLKIYTANFRPGIINI